MKLFLKRVIGRFANHRHKWQKRGVSRYGNTTYRVCLKCRKSQSWEGGIDGKFVYCDRIKELDEQFNEKDKYIFNH
jgi:hypothetical protein|tara:strand:+ start:582 stop:809 length:228 start_codon:yes stop_codon:yes gene_type:complete